MGMMIPSCSPTKLYKRINIYSTLIVITLCSIAYLLPTSAPPSPPSPTTPSSENSPAPPPPPHRSPPPVSFPSISPHHRAEDLIIINTTTSSTDDASSNPVHRFPACDVKLSEYMPCEDGKRSLRFPRERLIYRERHCPVKREEKLRCLIPAPHGDRRPGRWLESRDTIGFRMCGISGSRLRRRGRTEAAARGGFGFGFGFLEAERCFRKDALIGTPVATSEH
ncbi:putative methyltransferase PMT15 [Drosera capensis]